MILSGTTVLPESWIELRLYNALVKRGYHSTPEQKRHDRKKDNYLRKYGWWVMRFKGRQINGQMPQVIARIERKVETVKSGTKSKKAFIKPAVKRK